MSWRQDGHHGLAVNLAYAHLCNTVTQRPMSVGDLWEDGQLGCSYEVIRSLMTFKVTPGLALLFLISVLPVASL